MEEYCILAISHVTVYHFLGFIKSFSFTETLHKNHRIARAKLLDQSMKKPLRVRRRQNYLAKPPR